ncbi:hypothetical protein EXJ73_16305 [Pelomonas aquatica]|uniref:Uncharacterized protein n=1 Tax=Pelomonas aquatica TaxID=431058 RepID=A0A9X4LJU1_9BURK|nr:hypothetical protein [Pelomonas aquatica]
MRSRAASRRPGRRRSTGSGSARRCRRPAALASAPARRRARRRPRGARPAAPPCRASRLR